MRARVPRDRHLVSAALLALAAPLVAGAASVACSSDTFTGATDDAGAGGDVGPGDDDATASDAISDGADAADTRACTDASDVSADPLNCGGCGHDCLGGECVAGRCQPTIVADELDQPAGLASDGTHLYFGESSGAVLRVCPVDRCPVPLPPAIDTGLNVWDVRLVGGGTTLLYASDGAGNGVYAHATSGGARVPVAAASGGEAEQVLATSDGFYYSVYGSANASVVHVATPGGAQDVVGTETSGRIYGIAATNDHVYWANRFTGVVSVCTRPCAAASAATYLDLGSGAGAFGLTVVGTTVFVTSDSGGALRRCDADPATCNMQPTTLVSGLAGPGPITSDATNLYWANTYDGSISTCAIASCAATTRTLATGGVGPMIFVTIDDKAVYWSEGAGSNPDGGPPLGRIRRVAK